MKALKLLAAVALCAVSYTHAASITVKAKQKVEWSEEGAFLSTNKGDISIYAVGLNIKQVQNLKSIKKGDCVLITAKSKVDFQNQYLPILHYATPLGGQKHAVKF